MIRLTLGLLTLGLLWFLRPEVWKNTGTSDEDEAVVFHVDAARYRLELWFCWRSDES